jgi:hypothetical protein
MSTTTNAMVLSAKQMKLSSFINFYNKKLIEGGPEGTKEMVESISNLFGPISDQISFLNEYLDYETSLTLEYKDSCKQLIKSQKLLKKKNDTYQKSLLKYQAQYHKLFLKTLKNNNAFADLILLHLTEHLIPLLPPNQTNPKHALLHLQPNIILTLSKHALKLNHKHPINILLNTHLNTHVQLTPESGSKSDITPESGSKSDITPTCTKKGIQPSNYSGLLRDVLNCIED